MNRTKKTALLLVTVILLSLIIPLGNMTINAAEGYSSCYGKGSYGTVTGGNLRVRSEASTSGSQIGLIRNGTKVFIEGLVTYTTDGNVWCYAPDYKGYIAINWLCDIYDVPVEAKNASPDITCAAFTERTWRIGDSMSLVEIASTIRVSNYSSDYRLSVSNTDIASTFDYHSSLFTLGDYKARAVGIASITITATDKTGKYAPFSKTFKVTVYPSTMEEAIDVIVERLNGRFLTVNQKGCTGKNHKSCNNCEMHRVLASSWLHDLFPEITFSDKNFQQAGRGWTCWGGAQIITYIAAELLNGGNVKLDYNRAPKADSVFKFTKADVSAYATVGCHLRLNDSHSIVLLGVNSNNTVRCIDVNSHQDGTNSRVAVYNRKLNGTKMKIYKTTVR